MLTDNEAREFQALVFNIYGFHLSLAESKEHGERLIRLFELILRTRKMLAEYLLKS